MARFNPLGSSPFLGCCVLLMLSIAAPADSQVSRHSRGALDSALEKARFEEPMFGLSSSSSEEENEELANAIAAYNSRTAPDDFSALQDFAYSHPDSGWNVSLQTNLGLLYYHYGYFQKAMDAWRAAWERGWLASQPQERVVVDRAVGELARMHARLGHADELSALFAEIGDRHVSGTATEAIDGARDALWLMRNQPGTAYLCGPMALKNLLLALKVKPEKVAFLDDYRSGPHGVSLEEVSKLADQAQFAHRIVFRKPGQAIPVPSIVHWKITHFAAIVGEANGRYHLADPTFGRDLWVTRSAIDSESSGYFLVPAETGTLTSLRSVEATEASQVRGMGVTTLFEILATLLKDIVCLDCLVGSSSDTSSSGMATYNMHEMLVSLHITDTPVGYSPQKGPSVKVMLVYNQREAFQPALAEAFNVSQKWTLNWLGYVEDDPMYPGASVVRYAAGGGSVDETGYSNASNSFTPETRDASVLVLKSLNPIIYQRQLADGGLETYAESDGSTGSTRHIFLTQITDAQGNSVKLHYDSHLRLTSIKDATGRDTTFSYDSSISRLLVTKITDPFGRSASLVYDSSGRLVQITDVAGIKSQFTYDASSLINSMTTPYGTTTFAYGDNGNERFLNITDPLNYTERLEYLQEAPGIFDADPGAIVPQGMIGPWDRYLYGRDTWYWNKHSLPIAAGNYIEARNRHWTHQANNLNITSHTVEAIKYPLENRIWMNYPGQTVANISSAESGTFDSPIFIGRVLDDGTTQLSGTTYNTLGHPLSRTDEVGRTKAFAYAANNIDLVSVSQLTASPSTYETVSTYGSYNSLHEPRTYIGPDGKAWKYGYSSAGQLTSVTDPDDKSTTYKYDSMGRLTEIINANKATALTLTYDSADRVKTRTDSEGYKLIYEYDNLDRLTKIIYPDGSSDSYDYAFQSGSQKGKPSLDLRKHTDRLGRVTTYGYDPNRELTSVTQPVESKTTRTTSYAYYEDGTLKNIIDANGNITHWEIDLQSRPISKTYAYGTAEARTETYTYESTDSRLHAITDALGQVKTFTYAHDNRVTDRAYAGAVNPTPDVNYVWDPYFPRMTSMTDGIGTTNYTYAPIGNLGALRLASIAGPFTNDTIGLTYDELGRLTERNIPGGNESFSYDAISRLTKHAGPLGTFDFDYLGQTSQTTSRKVTNGNVTVSTSWKYDSNKNDRRLIDITNSGISRSYKLSYAIPGENGGKDNPYNIMNIKDVAPTGHPFASQDHAYSYDLSDRLLTATAVKPGNSSFVYDPLDNIISETKSGEVTEAAYNNLNEMTTWGSKNYEYDANGNTLTGDGARSYKWDAENRLIEIDYADGVSKSSFAYDGLNHRIVDTEVDAKGDETVNRYLWCGDRVCQTQSGSDSVLRRDLDEGEFNPVTNQKLVYMADQLGSVRDVLDSETGSRSESDDFGPYGEKISNSNGDHTDYQYAELFFHTESKLNLATYRVIDGLTGRWLSRDPMHSRRNLNYYVYVDCDPLTRIDEKGQFWWLFIPTAATLILTPANDVEFMGSIAGTFVGAYVGPLGGSFENSLGGNKFCVKLAQYLSDYDSGSITEGIFKLFGTLPDLKIQPVDPYSIPWSDPNWECTDGLCYYDETSALGVPER